MKYVLKSDRYWMVFALCLLFCVLASCMKEESASRYSDEELLKRGELADMIVTAKVLSVSAVSYRNAVWLGEPKPLSQRSGPCLGVRYEILADSKYQGIEFDIHYRGEFYKKATKIKTGQTVEVAVVKWWMDEKLAELNRGDQVDYGSGDPALETELDKDERESEAGAE